jgi:hypothetical protein
MQPSKPLLMAGESGLIAEIYKLGKAPFPLVEKSFRSSPTGYLRVNRQIVDATDLEALLHCITPDILSKADASIRDRFRTHLISSTRQRPDALSEYHNDLISKLPIFKRLVPCDAAERYRFVPWSEIDVELRIPPALALNVNLFQKSPVFLCSNRSIFSMRQLPAIANCLH